MEVNRARKRTTDMRIALGAIPYYWKRDDVRDFYRAAAGWPVAAVYLGETVCARRQELRLSDWLEIAGWMADAGKQVVLSTLGLVEGDAELRQVRAIAEQQQYLVEANDMNAVHLLAGRAPFVAGAALNVYNADTLRLLQEAGACRWVAPIELPGAVLSTLLDGLAAPIETEVIAHGRLPLAASARCFTARYHNLAKDRCEYRCLLHPDGIAIATQDGEPLFTLNGTQTLSTRETTLLGVLDDVAGRGVDLVRIGPRVSGTDRIVALFDAALRGDVAPALAQQQATEVSAGLRASDFWAPRPRAGGGAPRAPA
jgi:collagenase-like PrtC family protease